jgi:hypothetical protein
MTIKHDFIKDIAGTVSKACYLGDKEEYNRRLTSLFDLYRRPSSSNNHRLAVLEAADQLLEFSDSRLFEKRYEVGEALYKIPEVERVLLDRQGRYSFCFMIHLLDSCEPNEKWVKAQLELSTGQHFRNFEYLDKRSEFNDGKKLPEGFDCYSWYGDKFLLHDENFFAVK